MKMDQPNGAIGQQQEPSVNHEILDEGPKPQEEDISELINHLRSLWAKCLNIPSDDIRDDDTAISLGGNATQLSEIYNSLRSMGLTAYPERQLIQLTLKKQTKLIQRRMEKYERDKSLVGRKYAKDEVFPLSFAQEQIWLQLLESPSPLPYNISVVFQFHGNTDITALAKSANLFSQRHQTTRNSIFEDCGKVFQRVNDYIGCLEIPVKDFRDRAGNLECISEYMQSNLMKPFNLATGPLCLVYIILLSPELTALQCVSHHIVMDGTATHLCEHEIRYAYDALVKGCTEPIFPPVDIQFTDYVLWQRSIYENGELTLFSKFWQKYLENLSPLNLPTDGPRVPSIGRRAENVKFRWSEDLAMSILLFAKEMRVTPFVVLLSALNVLLGRLTGQTDVSVLTAKHGRTNPKTRAMIGHFVNLMIVRTNVQSAMTFKKLVYDVDDSLTNIYENQEYPFQYVIQDLMAVSNGPCHPYQLFPVIMSMTPKLVTSKLGEMTNYFEVDNGLLTTEILILIEEGEQLSGCIKYNPEIHCSQRIEQFLTNLEFLVENALKYPEREISRLDLMSAEDKNRILRMGAGREVPVDTTRSLVQLFESQVENTPTNVAVVEGDLSLSYYDLNKESQNLSLELQSILSEDELFVAVLLPQSVSFVRTTVAIMKAGKVVVPLGVNSPVKTMARMLQDIGNPLLISTDEVVKKLGFLYSRIHILGMDYSVNPTEILPTCHKPGPVYVLFTSGSTGRPKPVIINNSSVVNYCYWVHGEFGLSAVDRGLAFNAVTFDLSLHDIWTILLSGASMIIPPANLRYETDKLWQWIIYSKITFVAFPTAVGSRILSSDVVMEKSKVRVFMFGGACFRSWRPGLPFSLCNTYGLTETFISSTFTILDEQDSSSCGIPLWNTQIQILDEHLNVVPVGIPGKVYVSGAGVSQYWNRDELNKQKFEICPHSRRILCNTGDLGYWRFDGKLFITGRADHQIKIRGFRLEIGEVENAIRKYPNIIEAVVIPEKDDLSAYCRIKPGSDIPNFQKFNQYLKERLPYYAIPSRIFIIDHFPMTSNGKIDKSGLESQKTILVSPQFDPPQSEDEKIVAKIWADVLGLPVESIGRRNDFFSLGGHSLLIAEVVSRLYDEYDGVDLRVEDLLRKPTVCGFVEEILSTRQSNNPQNTLDTQIIQNRETHGLPLSLQQEQMWLHMQKLNALTIYNETFNLDFKGEFNGRAMNRALLFLVSRHDILRSNYKETNGSASMNISNTKDIFIQNLNLHRAGRVKYLTAQSVLFRSNKRLFKFEKEPLIRFRVVRISNTLTRLQVYVHHLILDGFGMHFLEMELRQLYLGFSTNAVSTLKPLEFQYPDFVFWQRKTLSTGGTAEKFKASHDFWKNQLFGLEPVNLLRHHQRVPEIEQDRTGSTGFQLSRALSENIRNYSASQNTTPFVVFLTALKVLIYRYTNQTDLFLLNTSGGRDHPEHKHTLGLFAGLVIVRTKITKNSTFTELVKLIHWNQIEIMKHRAYPFQNVVRAAGLDTKVNGLFRLALTMQPRSTGNSTSSSFFFQRSHHEPRFDLLIGIDEIERNFVIYLVFDKSIYDDDTMKRFETHFKQILYSALESPFNPIESLVFTSEIERTFLLQTNQDKESETSCYANKTNLYDLFLESVQRFPSNSAVRSMGSELTYFELFCVAGSLSNSLDQCCNGIDTFLAVLLPQSINFIVSVIAIQCLGKTCVPLSVEYATKQLEYMLGEVGNPILITTKSVLEVKGLKYARVIYIDEVEASGHNFNDKDKPNQKESPPYCLFTSASTGKAKAVILGHPGFINCVRWIKSECNLTDKDRALLFCSPAFDLSLGEIWPMLLSGGALCIPQADTRYDMHKLFEWMNQEHITFACVTTKIGEHIFNISAGPSGHHSSLRRLICCGEVLKAHPPKGVNFTVSNCYGITESSIVCTVNNMKNGQQGVPSVGRGISNMRHYVLESNTLTPVPVGVSGEIFVSGPGVALGYLNKPLKNLNTFIPDPFVNQSDGLVRTMMYKTGDLGYWLQNGELMVTGRQDSQIKILGHRIELGQIEESILEFGPIQETVVLLEDEHKLTAYCVGHEIPSLEGITNFLQQILPKYCIPSTFILIPKIPLNAIGKVDRKKLIEFRSNGSTPILTSNYSAPRTSEEIILARIWSDILRIPREQISREDNFFFLGGHSLQIAEMVQRLQSEPYNYCVSVRDVFRENTLRELSSLISKGNSSQPQPDRQKTLDTQIRRNRKTQGLPLSLQQEQMWLHMQENPTSLTLYNETFNLDFKGVFNERAMNRALLFLVSRHDILRSNYKETNGSAIMNISNHKNIFIQNLNLQRAGRVKYFTAQTVLFGSNKRPFKWERDPLIRFRVVRITNTRTRLQVFVHHLILDGYGTHFLEIELRQLYSEFSTNTVRTLKPLEFQYPDFVLWQRKTLSSERTAKKFNESHDFWKKQLVGLEPVNLFRHHRRVAEIGKDRTGSAGFQLSHVLSENIRNYSASQNTTPFVVFLTGLKVLIYRYTNQTDLFLLNTSAGRDYREHSGLLGFFASLVIVRTKITKNSTFTELVKLIHWNQIEIKEHLDYPFQNVLQDSGLDKKANGLFRLAVTMQPRSIGTNSFRSSVFFERSHHEPRFDLLIGIDEIERNFVIYLVFDKSIYDDDTMKRFETHFKQILYSALESPFNPIESLVFTSEIERTFLLQTNKESETSCIPNRTNLYDLFLESVERFPSNTAVRCMGSELTYFELFSAAGSLSNSLEECCSENDTFVAVLLPQSINFIVSVIAIQCLGKTCVPLSVAYATKQLEYMLEEVGNPILFTTKSVLGTKGLEYKRVFYIDQAEPSGNFNDKDKPNQKESPPYCLFTSASTGKAKAVILGHSGVINCVTWMKSECNLTDKDRALLFCSPAFDMSLGEIWPMLLSGGALCIPPADTRYDMHKLFEWMNQEHITFACVTTKIGEHIFNISAGPSGHHSSLRRLICCGEVLKAHPPKGVNFTVSNCYGITETSIVCTVNNMKPGQPGIPSVGRGISNMRHYVLESDTLTPVPIGVTGEIFVSGPGVALGYLNKPLKNLNTFIPDPFVNQSDGLVHTMMYKTGDLGYWLPTGELMVTGRQDSQIKILGHRIELGQIEESILEFGPIQETIVLLEDENKLTAYCVGQEIPRLEGITKFLQQILPKYCIPSTFIFVPKMPLNPIGKVDRKKLIEYSVNGYTPILTPNYSAPRTSEEIVLAGIWAHILRIPREQISREDNFFFLGGHSLQIAEMVHRLQAEPYNYCVSVRDVFRENTLRDLSCLISKGNLSQPQPDRQKTLDTQIIRNREIHSLPLSLQQEQMWLHMQDNPTSLTLYNETFNLDFRGVFNERAMHRALFFLVSRHDILRSNYKETNGSASMNISNPKNIFIQNLNLQRAGRIKYLTAQSVLFRSNKRPLKLEKEPLIRFRLLRISNTLTRLQVFIHHLIMDGIGQYFLEMELRKLYSEFSKNTVSTSKPLEFQYPDFVLWQRKKLTTEGTEEKFKASQDFWKKQLVGLEPVNLFRHHRRVGEIGKDRTGSTGFQLSHVLSENIRNYSASQNTTPFVVFLTALKVLIYRYTNQTDLFLLNTSGGRDHPELSGLLGFFASLVIVRTKITKNSTFTELVKLIHWNQIEIKEHLDYPFQNVVRDSGLDTKVNGLFRLAVTMQPRSIGTNSFRSSVFFERSHHEPKFDLLIGIDEIERNFVIYLVFDKSIYEDDTMKRFETHFKQILYSGLESPSNPIESLALTSEMERAFLLQINQESERSCIPIQTNLYELFLESVRRFPSNTAVSCMGSELTYSELFYAAGCLRNSLDRSCNENDTFLAVLLPQSINFIVSVIAIQCLGKTCVPLSVEYATKQLEYMLEEVGNPILITTKSVLGTKGLEYKRVFYIDQAEPSGNFNDKDKPNQKESPPYCLFTSASTGKAKAVILGHSGVINCVTWMKSECNLTDKDRALLFCSPAFDMSLGEIWPMLVSGGALCIPPDDARCDMHKLFDWMDQERITFACLTTKIGEIIFNISASPSGKYSSLRWLICSGEMLKTHPPKGVNFTVSNSYGNTETSIVCTVNNMKPGQQGVPNVGRGISNMRTYVLESDTLTPVPIGVTGEIFVSGPGVALGYLNKPLKNLNTFIPDPFVNQSDGLVHTMMYKTGDLGYWLPTGELTVTGRQDNQIKILGRRIELGQIEESILEFGPIQETIVLLEDENKISAYCVGQDIPSLEGITNFLRQILPQYCIPSTFIFVPKIPLNPIGKVDRKKLIEYRSNGSAPILTSNYSAPRTSEEIILAGIWSDILKIPQEKISREDNFFFLGGHSLQIAEMVHRLRGERYNYCLSVRDVFRENTLRKLSRLLSKLKLSRNTSAEFFSEISKDFTFYNVAGWLLKYPNIQQSAVIVENGSDSQSTVAFCVSSAPDSLTFIHLYRFLCSNLPHHVVPTEIYTLAELPLNKNGEIDKIRLLTFKSQFNRLAVQNPVPGRGFPLKTREEITIADIWSQILGAAFESISVVDTFVDLGGNSDQFENAKNKIRELFPGSDSGLSSTLTVGELAKHLALTNGSNVNELDIDFEMEIKFNLEIDSHLSSSLSGDILLTGSTGYLGSGLLVELLQTTQCKIHCLIRARNFEEAQRKLTAAILPYDLDKGILNRIEVVVGDVSMPSFGLTAESYEILAKSVSSIYHSAAEVHFLKNYSDLKQANVEGTKEVLRFSTNFTLKTLHFISTLGVFTDIAEPIDNNWYTHEVSLDETDICPHSYFTGYSQSKWVAEKLVSAAIKEGLPAIVYRPGQIGVHSQINHYNQSDLMATVLKSSLEIGFIPNSVTMPTIYYGSLDYHSQTICSISINSDNIGKVFHIFEHEVLFEDVVTVLSKYVPLITFQKWKAKLGDYLTSSSNMSAQENLTKNGIFSIMSVLDRINVYGDPMKGISISNSQSNFAVGSNRVKSTKCESIERFLTVIKTTDTDTTSLYGNS